MLDVDAEIVEDVVVEATAEPEVAPDSLPKYDTIVVDLPTYEDVQRQKAQERVDNNTMLSI